MDIEEDKDKAEQFKIDGNSAYKRKEYASAVELYTKAIMYCRSEPNYYANRAACYLAMEKYQLCISDSNRALDIDPNFTKVLRRKALSQMQLLQFDDAIANLTKGLSIDSSDENMRKDLGDCSRLKSQYTKMEENFKDDKMEDALTQLNIIIQTIPKNATLLVKKIIILAMKGSSDSAKQLLIQVQNMDDVQKDIHYLQGICELYNGNTDKAKTFFKQGMVMDPDNKKCREMLQKAKQLEELKEKGNQAIKDSNYDKSIQIYDQALLVDPKNRKLNSIILSNRALAYVKKKEYKKALDDVNLSISFNEQYFRAYLRRADIRMKMGDFDKALIDYQKVKELDPSQNVDSLINEARMQEKKAKKKDYYKILGVERTATDKEITKAYRKLALKWHPDKNQDNKEEADKIFRNINEAYQVLSDPKKKQMFDQGADPNDQESGGMPADFNPNDIFNMFFGGGGPGASRGGSSAGQGGFPGGFGGFPGFGSFGSGGGFGQGGFGQGGFGQGGGNQGFNFRFG